MYLAIQGIEITTAPDTSYIVWQYEDEHCLVRRHHRCLETTQLSAEQPWSGEPADTGPYS